MSYSQGWDYSPVPLVLPLVLLLVIPYILYTLLRPSGLPDLPIVGAKPGEWFPIQRAKWRNLMDMKRATAIAYNEYKDRACILPIAGAQNFVHLPHNELQWLLKQPDSEISIAGQLIDSLQFDHTLMDPGLVHRPVHISVVSGPLTRDIGNLIPDLVDEIKVTVDRLWGNGTEYRTICVFDLMRQIIGHATNRVFVGLPLCRNTNFLEAVNSFALDIPLSATLLQFFPRPIRPLVAPIITLPNRIHTNRTFRILRPEIRRRLKQYPPGHEVGSAGTANGNGNAAKHAPHDFLQWSIDQARSEEGDEYLGKVDTLAGRVLLNNFTSIHASSFIITHTILDLVSSKQDYMDELRREITTVLAEHGGEWNKRALASMIKLDSTIRESQRLNSFIITATNRKVIKPGGVTTPSGTHIPAGTMVCGPSYAVLHDPAIYPEPETFKPFRFTGGGINGESDGPEQPRLSLTKTSEEYAAFGHGRHACAGRFFAATTLKLMLAYILLEYDFELLEKRPENPWFGSNRIPPMSATIRVKRNDA